MITLKARGWSFAPRHSSPTCRRATTASTLSTFAAMIKGASRSSFPFTSAPACVEGAKKMEINGEGGEGVGRSHARQRLILFPCQLQKQLWFTSHWHVLILASLASPRWPHPWFLAPDHHGLQECPYVALRLHNTPVYSREWSISSKCRQTLTPH